MRCIIKYCNTTHESSIREKCAGTSPYTLQGNELASLPLVAMPRLTRNTLTQLDSLSNSPSAPPGPVYKQNAIMLWYKLKDTSSVPTKKSAMAMDIHGHDLADLEAFER